MGCGIPAAHPVQTCHGSDLCSRRLLFLSGGRRSVGPVVDLSVVLEDAELRRRYGSVTLERAVDYVRDGRVRAANHQIDEEGDLDIRGVVAGTAGGPYATFVRGGVGGRGVWVYSKCTCPVAESCKHALALLLTVRAEQESTAYAAGHRRWERQLGLVLDELDEQVESAGQAAPLALQLDLSRPPANRYRGWS